MTVLKRLSIYSKEQLEPVSRLLLSFLTAFFVELILSKKPQVSNIIIPSLSVFMLLAYYRVSDEFKDYETDKKFFPDRPIPSGRLFLSDLKWLLFLFAGLSLFINLVWNAALFPFVAALAFTVAMGKWFFLEKTISKNRILAFITHAPVGYFLYFYVTYYISSQYEMNLSIGQYLSLITFLVLPGFTWEILRKTFLPQDEMPGYQTYSMMLGFKGSLAFAAGWIILTLVNNYLLTNYFFILKPVTNSLTVVNVLLLVLVIIHSFIPLVKNLKKLTEIYMALHLIIPMVYLISVIYGK